MTAWLELADDLGEPLRLKRPPGRVVSLVPSVTETVFALGAGERLVAATRYCVVPRRGVSGLVKVGGTKNPDIAAILRLAPDLVLANAEENRAQDVQALRAGAVPVFVTYPRTIQGAAEMVAGLGRILGCVEAASRLAEQILEQRARRATQAASRPRPWPRLFVPIWKNPWMSFNRDSYAHDLLAVLGFENIYADFPRRYPATTLEEAFDLGFDAVLLPDEPYRFDQADAEELRGLMKRKARREVRLISGRDLHWYGRHTLDGLGRLAEQVKILRRA
ncbi:MAG: helical backbone metal receptor [Deltaproteobacteria bacterium]|nr:helical backbone metal receptor [Deltaproteobacteria bacterium]